MKSLREKKCWSQEQLAQFSGLNVRTIQRLEKGERVGKETIKSLAAVFEVSTDELLAVIDKDHPKNLANKEATELANQQAALQKSQNKKYFYGFTAFLSVIFVAFMLPNYNGGENLSALVAIFLCFLSLVIGLAIALFEPFGKH